MGTFAHQVTDDICNPRSGIDVQGLQQGVGGNGTI
jgi:hypothetical protein